jgi:diacylglycerol O-acyltransferase / wax synthase
VSTQVIPLGPEDRAILALESPTVVGHTCKVLRLGRDAPSVERLRERVAQRIALAPALTRRLTPTAESPGWESDLEFDPRRHILPAPVDEALDRAGLLALVARLFEQRLRRDRPLWRMDVARLADGDSAIVWRIHHALADGATSVRYASALLWDDAPELRASPHEIAQTHASDEARRVGHLAGFLAREFARGHSPFDGTIGTRREIGFSAVSLGELRTASKAIAEATVNDAVLSVLAGALRRWLHDHHGHLGTVRVRVPVSLHHEGEQAANRDSYFSLALPLNEPDALARLRAVHRETTARKAARDAEHMDALMHELSGVSPRLQRFCTRVQQSPREFALCVSNVSGPRSPVRVLGTPVRAIHSIAEIGERHALRISVISLAGSLYFGFCADPDLIDGVQEMADSVPAEARELIGAVRAV